MLPCWQLQELAEGIGDINTEAKILLLIITFMCVRGWWKGWREEKEAPRRAGTARRSQ